MAVTYEPAGDLMQAVRLDTDTIHGRASVVHK